MEKVLSQMLQALRFFSCLACSSLVQIYTRTQFAHDSRKCSTRQDHTEILKFEFVLLVAETSQCVAEERIAQRVQYESANHVLLIAHMSPRRLHDAARATLFAFSRDLRSFPC